MRTSLPTGAALLLLLTGCASIKPVVPRETTFDMPPLNQIGEKELGDTLIDKGRIRSYPAIVTSDPTEGHWGIGGTMHAEPGMFIAVGTTDFGTMYRALSPVRWTGAFGLDSAKVALSSRMRAQTNRTSLLQLAPICGTPTGLKRSSLKKR